MQINGTKTEKIWVDISLEDIFVLLNGYLNFGRNVWVAQSEKNPNKLALWSDHGGSHYSEGQDRELTEQEEEYYKALQIVKKYLKDK